MKNEEENCIIIDWFAATTRIWDPVQLIFHLGLEQSAFQQTYGFYGYAQRLMYGGISIHYALASDPDSEKTSVMVEMSGQGCREYETLSSLGFMPLFCDIANGDLIVKRLDIAFDDKSENGDKASLDLGKIAQYTIRQRFVSKWGGGQVVDSFRLGGNDKPMIHALTVQFGSRQSAIMLRIYDKAQERGGLDCHWVRAELVLKDERATGFIAELLSGKPIGELYAGVLRNYLRFIRLDHSRRERCSMVGWWDSFLGNAEKIRLYTPQTVEYNLARVERYVLDQAGNSTLTYLLCAGEDRLLSGLHKRLEKLNDNQRRLIEEHANVDDRG